MHIRGGHPCPDAFPLSVFKMCGSHPQPADQSLLMMDMLPSFLRSFYVPEDI